LTALLPAEFWSSWKPATCLPDGCFCEAVRQGPIAQPANFWSSFAFLLVAILLWAKGDRRLYAAALFLVGAGSALYHGSLTFAGQVADMSGMYFVATFAILDGLERKGKISGREPAIAFLAANALLISMQVAFPDARRYVFAALILCMLMVERDTGWSRHLKWAIAIFGIGFAFWVVDKTHLLCAPESLWQGHAVWHLTGAGAAWVLYAHLRSLRQRSGKG
jgi:hypothetical protein